MNTWLRLCFEPKVGTNVNDQGTIRHIVEKHLSDSFPVRYAGYISVDQKDRSSPRAEPLWQYLIEDHSPACRDYLVEFLARNPTPGYNTIVFEKVAPGGPEVRVG